MSTKALSSYTQYAKYARYIPVNKRRENWNEMIDRMFEMHQRKYSDKIDLIKEDLDFAKDLVLRKRILGSQRALQFGGDPILKHEARLYNCLRKSTRFITRTGVRSFEDYSDGDELVVLTHNGNWKKAKVRNYGKDKLYPHEFIRGNNKYIVYSTLDHNWILKDGQKTKGLKEGDNLYFAPSLFNSFEYDKASPNERLYWCYGYIYGNGTLLKDKEKNPIYSMVRLCSHEVRFAYRFEEMGFSGSSSLSIKGDIVYHTGKYLKTLPDPEIDSWELVRAFIRGFLDADGCKNKNGYYGNTNNRSLFQEIQQSKKEAQDFIEEFFPIVGVYIYGFNLVNRKTNKGEHKEAKRFSINTGSYNKYIPGWKLKEIGNDFIEEEVWCLEVEDDHSFVLPNGIVTGNCTASYVDRVEFFPQCMYLLLCGCGVGFSVQKHHVEKLPRIWPRDKGRKKFTIPDTIEGWADAIGILMSSYFGDGGFPEYAGYRIEFDYSKIRPAGAQLSSGSKAPGPEGLRKSINKISELLTRALNSAETKSVKASPVIVYDIIMHMSDAVLSGGVRRSATICLFSLDDEEMVKAKTGNWFIDNPQRARSNNSALLLREKTTPQQFSELMKSVREFGEPGFVWAENKELLVNPCAEIGLYARDDKSGKSGFQFCNLCEINLAKCKTEEEFLEACRGAAILGTIQAGYTSFPYLGKTSEKIVRKESLLGVSMTGMMDTPEIAFDPKIQRKGALLIRKINTEIAEKLGINKAARCTCIKPSGTASCILGSSSGIHPHHSKRYFRRVQANKLEAPAQFFAKINPKAVEESNWSNNNTDVVISFLCEVPDGAKTKNEVSAHTLLAKVKLTQQNWVEYGTDPETIAKKWLRHNVSNTITVEEHEWKDVEEFIYRNRRYFAGITLLPMSGDLDYSQAPFTRVMIPTEIVREYGDGAVFASGLIERALDAYANLWEACDALLGIGEPLEISSEDQKGLSKRKLKALVDQMALKEEWLERATNFANNYMDGDLRKCTYLLKNVYNWKEWVDLKREYKDIDWTKCVEEKDCVKFEPGAACSGGLCDLGDLGVSIKEKLKTF